MVASDPIIPSSVFRNCHNNEKQLDCRGNNSNAELTVLTREGGDASNRLIVAEFRSKLSDFVTSAAAAGAVKTEDAVMCWPAISSRLRPPRTDSSDTAHI